MGIKEDLEELGITKGMSVDEINARVEALKALNEMKEQKTNKTQKILDWLVQPVVIGQSRPSDALIIREYWEGVSKRDRANRKIENKHVHFHNYALENPKEIKRRLIQYNEKTNRYDIMNDD